MSPLTTTLPFIDPINFALSTSCKGISLATGWPLLVITTPCDPSSSRILRHFALNSVALIRFSIVFMTDMISNDQSDDQYDSQEGAAKLESMTAYASPSPFTVPAWAAYRDNSDRPVWGTW